MKPGFRVALVLALGSLLTSCATQVTRTLDTHGRGHVQKVRTTAYTHTEGSGGRNAIGQRLSGGGIMSASSDWSRFPVGTRFRLVSTGEEFVIDDYGGEGEPRVDVRPRRQLGRRFVR